MTVATLREQHCQPRSGPALARAEARRMLTEVRGWALDDNATAIDRTFRFENYYETIAFVNALAWIAHREDHHPDLEVRYNRCRVHLTTHSVQGLSENDFICAAKIDALTGA